MSTVRAVLDLSDHILGNFDRGEYTVATFSDLSKTFDTLNRSILICKLRCYGVNGRALQRFFSYLIKRKRFLNMLDVSSLTILINIAIAQGSCLGPLMFVVYMNNIAR